MDSRTPMSGPVLQGRGRKLLVVLIGVYDWPETHQ